MKTAKTHILLVAAPVTMTGGTIRRLRLWNRHAGPDLKLDLLFSSSSPREVAKEVSPGISPFSTKTMNRLGRVLILPGFIKILWTIYKERPHYVLGMFLWSGLAAGLAVKLGRALGLTKARFGMHIAGDPVPPGHTHGCRSWVYTLIAKLGLALADDVIPISSQLERLLRESYLGNQNKQVCVVPIGIETPEQTKDWRTEPEATIRFGVISRLTREKGVQYALLAMARLLNRGMIPSLEIYGEGPFRQALEQQARNLGLEETVHFHGWTREPLEAMRKIECLLLPSESEGTPRSILEAASVGVPSIATNIGGIPDIIRHSETGWLVPFGSPEALEATMAEILHSPQALEKAGNHALATVRDRHNLKKELHDLQELAQHTVAQ